MRAGSQVPRCPGHMFIPKTTRRHGVLMAGQDPERNKEFCVHWTCGSTCKMTATSWVCRELREKLLQEEILMPVWTWKKLELSVCARWMVSFVLRKQGSMILCCQFISWHFVIFRHLLYITKEFLFQSLNSIQNVETWWTPTIHQ